MAKKKKSTSQEGVQNIRQKSIGEISREGYLEFGNYVNNHRHMARVNDGMKNSYRRLVWSALQFPKGKMIASNVLINNTANYHPHGLLSFDQLNAALVNSGIFEGTGAFGSTAIDGTEMPCANPRYTKNRISDQYYDLIGDLVKEVPMRESEAGGIEPEYIPLPLPLCLILKTQVSGLGLGAASSYPSFSPISLYQAYVNNNPLLLEPNVNIMIDKSSSELEKLWRTGKGRVCYVYKTTRQMSPDGKSEGVLFEGDTEIFTPNLKKFKKLEEDGKVYVEDLTDVNGPKLFVGRVPGARGCTIEQIEGIARKANYSATNYTLNVSDGNTTFRMPLYNWLDHVFKNYIQLLQMANVKRIVKTKFDISVQEALPTIADYIINKNPNATDQELVSTLGVGMDVVKEVMSKPISWLRKNRDTSDRVKALKARLRDLKKFDPIRHTENIISGL